ncbi:uncharacterized protein HaLaN_18344, partial [Haematococcus lacustris]
MLRQYKAMQEQLLRRIEELEGDNRGLKASLEERDQEIKKLQEGQEAQRKACDAEVSAYQRKMEDMQVDFTQMLRDTLDKMQVRLSKAQGLA